MQLTGKDGSTYYANTFTGDEKDELSEDEEALLLPAVDPYNNKLLMPFKVQGCCVVRSHTHTLVVSCLMPACMFEMILGNTHAYTHTQLQLLHCAVSFTIAAKHQLFSRSTLCAPLPEPPVAVHALAATA